jgi:hypothetical protein
MTCFFGVWFPVIIVSLSFTGCDDFKIPAPEKTNIRFDLESVFDISEGIADSADKEDFQKFYEKNSLYMRDDSTIDVYPIILLAGDDKNPSVTFRIQKYIADSAYQFRLLPTNTKSISTDTLFHVISINQKYVILTKKNNHSKWFFVFRSAKYK